MIPFFKMSGAGNDFILIDNRRGVVPAAAASALARRLCPRRTAVGADGLILLDPSAKADLRMRILNADGSEPEMCGNGARCAAFLAHRLGMAKTDMTLETLAGILPARIVPPNVRIGLPDVEAPRLVTGLGVAESADAAWCLNTGVPHAVLPVERVEEAPVTDWGRAIRNHKHFAPAGTNVDFIALSPGGSVSIRTYERGVEDETLACGTGATAGAIVAARLWNLPSPVSMHTRGGDILTIRFQLAEPRVTGVFLEGPVRVTFTGETDIGEV
jgi:diaminopimelate epimerase